ncbi:MAG: GMC family oxidoreductase [Alcanivoracaceae bacterium]|nr:GMC family oxidoreductase [Alcanivoracaceae bacterium]
MTQHNKISVSVNSTEKASSHFRAKGLNVVEGRTLNGDVRLRANVVIVGSGAGGSVVAYELARQGLSVLVLEAGPYVPSEKFSEDFTQSLEHLYADAGAQTNKEGDLLVLQGACVGGSTVVNACAAFRTPDFILRDWQEKFGLVGLSPESMLPYFERVEKHLSVEENGEHEIAKHSQLARQGANKLGWSVKPLKRNIRDCALTGHCLSGCKTDRKQSMLVTYLPWALASGASLYSDVMVTRVKATDGRANGVIAEVRNADGAVQANIEVSADLVVVAAGAIQSPLLLQKSELANSSDQVGRNFACHPSLFVAARYPMPVHPWRGALVGVYIDEFMLPEKGGFILEAGGLGAVELCLVTEPGTGAPFVDYMRDAKHYSGIVTLIHDHNVGRISWQDGEKRIDYALADEDFESMLAALAAAARVHFAAGAEKVFVPSTQSLQINSEAEIDQVLAELRNAPQVLRMVSYHPQGTCRMGADPANSVVSEGGECHDVAGLYVADASLFPTSIIVNPQVTVYAMASRIADQILARRDEYFSEMTG